MDSAWSRARFLEARVARLATADTAGRPHLVPIVFAVVGDTIYMVVDHKPKSGVALRRLHNMRVNPQVSVLVDHYSDDWSRLWWARADGAARLIDITERDAVAPLATLTQRYPQYRQAGPPGPMVAIAVRRWSGWAALPQ